MSDVELWSVIDDKEIKKLRDDIACQQSEIKKLGRNIASLLKIVESISQKLYEDSVRRRNKNLRQKIPFPFMRDHV